MKRVILTVLIVVVLVSAALPGIAIAKHGKKHKKPNRPPPALIVYCQQNPGVCQPGG